MGDKGWLEIVGARENNLKNIDVRIPMGTMTCVTGVSGSGKSTLVDGHSPSGSSPTALRGQRAARRALGDQRYRAFGEDDRHRSGADRPHAAQQSRHVTRASSTMSANLYSKLPSAKVRGYEAGRFSFNVKGGRCEKCKGDGLIKIEMSFSSARLCDL